MDLAVLRAHAGRLVDASIALGVAVLLAARMHGRTPFERFDDVVLLWALLTIAFVAALAPPIPLPTSQGLRRFARRREVHAVGAILLLAFLLRAVNLETVPRHFQGDEGVFAFAAIETQTGVTTDLFTTGWTSNPTLVLFFQGAMMRIVGNTIAGVRALSVLGGVLGVLVTYALARFASGRPTAFVAAALLTAYHADVYFSRTALRHAWDSVWVPLALLLLLVGIEGRRWWAFGLAGLVAGFAQYWYFGSRIIPILGIAVLAHAAFWARPALPSAWRALALFVAGTVVGMLPLVVNYADNPDDYLTHVAFVSIDSLATAGDGGAAQMAMTYLDHLGRNLLAYHRYAPRSAFFPIQHPLLDPLSGAFILVGVALCGMSWRSPRSFAPLAGVLLVVSAVSFTDNPPQAQQLFTNVAPLIILVAVGLVAIVSLLASVVGATPRWRMRAIAAVTVVVMALNTWLLFGEYLPSGRDEQGFTEIATELGHFLRDENIPVTYYFFAKPQMSTTTHASLPFIARHARGIDVPPPPAPAPPFAIGPEETLFVFLTDRVGELPALRASYPGPDPLPVRDSFGQTLFWVYRPGPLPAS